MTSSTEQDKDNCDDKVKKEKEELDLPKPNSETDGNNKDSFLEKNVSLLKVLVLGILMVGMLALVLYSIISPLYALLEQAKANYGKVDQEMQALAVYVKNLVNSSTVINEAINDDQDEDHDLSRIANDLILKAHDIDFNETAHDLIKNEDGVITYYSKDGSVNRTIKLSLGIP
jgi:hypothetical protein